MTGTVVTRLRRYPVKSCRGHDLTCADVEPWGLAGDRRWMLVDADGVAVTARTRPRLLQVVPEPCAEGLVVHAPGATPLRVPVPAADVLADVAVWSSKLVAAPAAAAAHAWFSAVVGEPVRLVHLDDPTLRPTEDGRGLDSDRVTFADAQPILLTSADSLAALQRLVGAEELDVVRFRPNVVVAGAPAGAEEYWRRIRIGAVGFRVVESCSRCVITATDPWTAVRGREPLATLARHHRRGGVARFGVYLVPDAPFGRLEVGDPVEVLDVADSPLD